MPLMTGARKDKIRCCQLSCSYSTVQMFYFQLHKVHFKETNRLIFSFLSITDVILTRKIYDDSRTCPSLKALNPLMQVDSTSEPPSSGATTCTACSAGSFYTVAGIWHMLRHLRFCLASDFVSSHHPSCGLAGVERADVERQSNTKSCLNQRLWCRRHRVYWYAVSCRIVCACWWVKRRRLIESEVSCQ